MACLPSPCGSAIQAVFCWAVTGWVSSPSITRRCLAACVLHHIARPVGGRWASIRPSIRWACTITSHFMRSCRHPTLIQGVRKAGARHPDACRAGRRITESTFWSLEYGRSAEDESRSFDDWRDMLLDALRAAVRRRHRPMSRWGLAVRWRGSSLIVGLMSEAGVPDMRTYNVGFEDVGARRATSSNTPISSRSALVRCMNAFLCRSRTAAPPARGHRGHASEPMVSHDCIGFYLLRSGLAPQQGGAKRAGCRRGVRRLPLVSGPAGSAQPVQDYLAAFRDRDHAEYAQTVQPQYLTGDCSADWVQAHFAGAGADDPVEKALRLDTTVMLVDDPVKRVDNMTMAFGLEARVPFLDHELVELAARIPVRHKLAGGGKGILREAARMVVPSAVIDRPRVTSRYRRSRSICRGNVLANVRDALSSRAARERGLFQQDTVDRLLADPMAHITPLRGSKLWQLGLLEQWLQTHLPA